VRVWFIDANQTTNGRQQIHGARRLNFDSARRNALRSEEDSRGANPAFK
jgi:hypothetical protein